MCLLSNHASSNKKQMNCSDIARNCFLTKTTVIFLRKQEVCNKGRKESESVSCSVMPDSFATPWTVAPQASLSMGFSRQEYWNGSPFQSPGDLPDPGIKSRSPALQADSLPSDPPGNAHQREKSSSTWAEKGTEWKDSKCLRTKEQAHFLET